MKIICLEEALFFFFLTVSELNQVCCYLNISIEKYLSKIDAKIQTEWQIIKIAQFVYISLLSKSFTV